MKPELQRIAIAEACPGLMSEFGYRGYRWSRGYLVNPWTETIIDPLNDLNAMHEAEKILSPAQLLEYAEALMIHCGSHSCVKATAAQRAEAFLRTIGKWEDEQ